MTMPGQAQKTNRLNSTRSRTVIGSGPRRFPESGSRDPQRVEGRLVLIRQLTSSVIGEAPFVALTPRGPC